MGGSMILGSTMAENPSEPLRLHIGGWEVRPGWKILDVLTGPKVDFVGNCTDLRQFAENSVQTIYASHVLEHLGYQEEVISALREMKRVLVPGGELMFSVPDLEVLSKLFVHPQLGPHERFKVMRMMFGGQMNSADFHRMGWTWEFAQSILARFAFTNIRRVSAFGLFNDTSRLEFGGVPISLNVMAEKPGKAAAK